MEFKSLTCFWKRCLFHMIWLSLSSFQISVNLPNINGRISHLWLAASDGPRPDGACLLVPAEDFGDAAVRHPQLTGDDTGTDAVMGHLHDFMADMVWERSAVYEDAAELVDPTLS